MQALIPLDYGTLVDIKGQMTNRCVFTLCFLGDMPQQAENSGFKTARAVKGCRFCYIDEGNRGDLDYDRVHGGWFHHQTVGIRKEMNSISTKSARNEYGSKWGLNPELLIPPLVRISPALDLILTRPAEPAHSEYGGISKLSHEMLIQAVVELW
jgi:hypothetical protein